MIELIEEIDKLFSSVGGATIILIVLLLLTNLPTIIKSWDFLISRFGIETKGSLKRKEQERQCVVQAAAIKSLENRIAEYDKTNHEHWNTSKSYQSIYSKNQQDLIDSIKELRNELKDMRKTTDERFAASEQRDLKRVRAEMKDKIGERYRRYHAKGEINDMEYESLSDLIDEYEAAGGENSFVHSVVQCEMQTWNRI